MTPDTSDFCLCSLLTGRKDSQTFPRLHTSPRDETDFTTILRRTLEDETSDLPFRCVTAIKLLNYRFTVLMKTPSVLPEQIRCSESESVIAVLIEQTRSRK